MFHKNEEYSQGSCYIKYNSLISICILSEDYESSQYAKFLYAEENLDHTLNFKFCKKNLLDYSDIKGSLFYIRNVEECTTNFGDSEKQENISKELGFSTHERVLKNTKFYLQHMASKKFVSIEKMEDNSFALILMKNIDKAANFYLRKVKESRDSKEYMNLDDIFNLSIYVEDDDYYYFLKDDKTPIEKNNKAYKIIIGNKIETNFYLLDQHWCFKETNEIYSGQLINIIFTLPNKEKKDKKEKMMLCVKKKEKEKNNDLLIFNSNDKEEEKEKENSDKTDEYYVTAIPYCKELSVHVLNNAFWSLEEDAIFLEDIERFPILIKRYLRIKNLNIGLYLNISGRKSIIDNDISIIDGENKLYKFNLVDEKILKDNFRFEYNFLFSNYEFDNLIPELVCNEKYILNGVYKKLNIKKDFNGYQYYYLPVSLKLNKAERIEIRQEDDFIFTLKKVDLLDGFQITYIKKIIDNLNNVLKSENNEVEDNDILISKSVKFFLEYLLNIDYSFRDENYESNVPIRQRQILLYEFNIVETINKILELYLKKYSVNKNSITNDEIKRGDGTKNINTLLINIIKFFKNLSLNKEIIKQSIYIIALNNLQKLSDIIFHDNITDTATLVDFIFNLVDNSEALQDYLLGDGRILKSQNGYYEDNYNMDNLLREEKLFKYIEQNHNYLLYYEKLIGLNKVQYKRNEIENQVKEHINKIKNEKDKKIKTYKQIIDNIILELVSLIKKHAPYLDKYNNYSRLSREQKSKTKRSIFRKKSFNLDENNEKQVKKGIKDLKEIKRKSVQKKTAKIEKYINLEDSSRMETENKLIEKEENVFDFDSIEEREESEKKEKEKEEKKEKDENDKIKNFDLKKTYTSDFFKVYKRPQNNLLQKNEVTKIQELKSEFIDEDPDENTKKIPVNKSLKLKDSKLLKSKANISSLIYERKESLKQTKFLSYKDYLLKLSKIYEFLQFFSHLDLDKALFLDDYFKELIKDDLDKGDNFDNSLYLFYIRKPKDNNIINKNIINLYLFNMYNVLFPDIKSNLKEKRKKNGSVKGSDILLEIKEMNKKKSISGDASQDKNEKNEFDEFNENEYKNEMIKDFNSIDENMCILYSIYQFLINQYTKTVYKLFNLKSNYYINFLSKDDIKISKESFLKIINNLFSKISFLNNDFLESLYRQIRLNPSLLNEEIDVERLIQNQNKVKDKKLSRRESMLIEYLYFFLKKSDEIRYIYEKISTYSYIKKLMDKENYKENKNEIHTENNEENNLNDIEVEQDNKNDIHSINNNNKKVNQENNNKQIIEKLMDISKNLVAKKLKILSVYEKLINSNKNYSDNDIQKDDNISEDKNIEKGEKYKFMVLKKSEFITQLLKNYEIKKFFNNIIYIEAEGDIISSDKSIKKLKRIRDYFTQIDDDILKFKQNFEKNNELDKKKLEKILDDINTLNRKVGKVCNEHEQIFNLDYRRNENESQILTKMLIQENKLIYKKIKFTKSFERMIKNIKYIEKYNSKAVLSYCSYLLKLFIDLKKNDNNFHKNIVKYFYLYEKLLYKSIHCINCFKEENITEEIETYFLNISYRGIEAFLIILNNCKLEDPNKLKDFIERIFSELKNIFNKFYNKKNRIIYQILYTYAVSRILLFLNKQRSLDSNIYGAFFNFIYPLKKMKENLSFCFETINKTSNKEHIIDTKKDIFKSESSSMINEESDDSFSKYIQDEEKESLIMKDFKDKIIRMDLSFVNKDIDIAKAKNKNNSTNLAKNKTNIINDFVRWEDEDEINRISFYLNFISVYVIYLNDKNNSIKADEDNEFLKKEEEQEVIFSFTGLQEKIKVLLDTGHYYDNIENKEFIEDDNTRIMVSRIENSISKEEKKFLGDIGPKNIDYKYFSTLLEAILFYRANLNGHIIEIQVKKVKKMNDNDKKKDDEMFDNKDTNDNNIIFYYYKPEYFEIFLIEKILNEIELKENLINYCLDDTPFEKNNSALLDIFLKDKTSFRIIQSYYDDEYNLIHNYFIKNNMELLISKITKAFTSEDFNKISEMENYLYKRMGEIYSNTDTQKTSLQKNISLVQFFILNEQNLTTDLKDINLLCFFDSLIYIYQKFGKSISIIYYKIGFELLFDKCINEFIPQNKEEDKNNKDNTHSIKDKDSNDNNINNKVDINIENKFDLEAITNTLILLFSSKINLEIIEDKKVFSTMLSSMKMFFLYILSKGGGFIFKNMEIFKELFSKLNFILKHLYLEFRKIVSFMKVPSKTKDLNKFEKKKNKLINILDFLIIFLEFKKINEDILTKEIFDFSKKVAEKVINLLFILLELPSNQNFEAINILIEFLFSFIKGPDITNLNLLFSLGFLDLVKYVIKDIDYYNIFLNYLSKDDLNKVIDNYAAAECKIIKIFIIYYNISHGNYKNNIEEFEKIQLWYDSNFDIIKKKLKRLYYISKKEMEGGEYNIDKMLLFARKKYQDVNYDKYNYEQYELIKREGISNSINKNKYEVKINQMIQMRNKLKGKKNENKIIENNKHSDKDSDNNDYCIIKFDLLLAYYSLYNYHIDLSTKTELNVSKKNIIYQLFIYIIDISILLGRMITIVFYAIYFIVMKLSVKKKTHVDLLQNLKNIEYESQIIEDTEVINFLKKYIKELEISLNKIIYKVYFPMLDKANILENYKEEYYKVEQIDSSDFINYLLSNYDSIHIRAKEYVKINKIIKLPILNVFFQNIESIASILIIFSLISNLLIMLSYNDFVNSCDDEDGKFRKKEYVRLECPYLLYEKRHKSAVVLYLLSFLGILELVLQTIIFIDYIVRIFSVELAKIKLKYEIKNLKKGEHKNYTFMKILELIFECIFNFRSLYYILSIVFICFGLSIHPFFYCITLLEFVNRIQLMQAVLKAMYEPIANILITLLMFIILEYLFSLFAVSYFTYDFPNITDTSNFLKIFMRTIEQTFKQDGGAGTYLNKELAPDYSDYSVSAYFNIKLIYDLLFFLLIVSLIFQLFLSTIIDYFNETRENNENFKEGLETNCTVCGMEREKIEKIYSNNKNAFEKHITYFHNSFNYIYYLMYIQSSSFRDAVIENGVWSLHLNKNLSYLPKNSCFKQYEKKCWKILDKKKKIGNEKEK